MSGDQIEHWVASIQTSLYALSVYKYGTYRINDGPLPSGFLAFLIQDADGGLISCWEEGQRFLGLVWIRFRLSFGLGRVAGVA